MNSAECCEFDKKNQPITSEGIIQWSHMLGLSTAAVRSDLWSRIGIRVLTTTYSSSTVVQRCSTSNMYLQSFVFAGRIE